ncbi:MAG: hypothetical protein Q7S68_05385 [Deltaproteobacteria bacterium]|nr:hypothetical protein [Deltaproteobacteria bacterium]
MGNIALQTGKLEEAQDFFQKSLLLEKKSGQEKGAIFSDNNFGLVLALQGKFDAAGRFFKERIRQVSKERVLDQISLHSGLGFALIQASQFNEAIKILQKAKELAEKAGVLSVQFSILGNLVTALLKEGRYAEGLQFLKELGAMQARFGSRRDIAFNLLRQGDVSMILGMGEGARESFEKGRKIAAEIDEQNLLLWFQLMESYWERIFGRPEEARKRLEDLVRQARSARDITLVTWGQYGLADLFAELGKKEEGLKALEKITNDLPDEEFMARKKLVEGRLLDFSKAAVKPKEFFEPLEKICLDNHFYELLWEVYYAWGTAEQSAGDAKRGAKFLAKGAELLKELSGALPEEYRDRYLSQRERQRLMQAWEESNGSTQEKRVAGKIVSDDRRGPKSTATMTSPLKKKR